MSNLEDIQQLLSWGREMGIYINPKLTIPAVFPPGYVGVQTQDQILPHETLISVPNKALLSTKIISPPELQEIYDSHPELFSTPSKEHEDFRMITYILQELEKGENSFWHLYFKSLPKSPENLLDWSPEDLAELQDPSLAYDTRIRTEKDNECNVILHETLIQYPNIFNSESASLSKCIWAWRIIVTRSFGKCIPYSALIPIGDLLNHDNCKTNYYYGKDSESGPDYYPDGQESDEEDNDEEVYESPVSINLSSQKLCKLNLGVYEYLDENFQSVFKQILGEARKLDAKLFVKKLKVAEKVNECVNIVESDDRMFKITAAKDKGYEAGDQVHIPYGRYSNRMLLTNYGFALSHNKYNYARVTFALKDLLSQTQLEKLTQHYNGDMRIAFKIKYSYFNVSLHEIVRGLLWDYQCDTANSFFSPTNLELESTSLSRMRFILSKELDAFPTSLEADRKELESPRDHKHYFSMLYRIGVKESLNGQILLIDIASEIIARMRQGENAIDASRIVADLETENSNFYIDYAYHRKSLKEYLDQLSSAHPANTLLS